MSFSDAIGLLGGAIILFAFAYANITANLDKRSFNALNLLGAVLLMYSLYYHFNLASMVLEWCWGAIALWGLIKALRKPSA